VDKNPRAVDLAKLSLWLATLARDHEFTFLDHALKCGNSLVGLTTSQIAAANWSESKLGLPLFRQLVKDRVAEAMKARAEIQAAPDDTTRAIQEARHRAVEGRLAPIRTMGDAVISAFFAAGKPNAREKKRAEIESFLTGSLGTQVQKLEAAAATLRNGKDPIPPFHWQIEFPEVFARANGGFDAIVGNPPFAGKNTVAASNRALFGSWLQTLNQGAHGNADLVAHFFRRAFSLLREGGLFGLIATNTIGQGDTRASGLTAILSDRGAIQRAKRRLKWPGDAAVTVSVVHVAKGEVIFPILDGRQVRRISAYLVEGDLDVSPASLAANMGKAFVGSYVLGQGFIFDNLAAAKGESESLEEMRELTKKEARNGERIFPYIGGEDVNTDPRHEHHRFIIDFEDFPERRDSTIKLWATMNVQEREKALDSGVVPADFPQPVANDWPDLLAIVERRVRGRRGTHSTAQWWRFERRRGELYTAAAALDRLLVRSLTSSHFSCFAQVGSKFVFDQTLIVWTLPIQSGFALLASRVHETWTLFLGATLEDRGRYNIEDCFRNFPFRCAAGP
jgi:hypothetical protein